MLGLRGDHHQLPRHAERLRAQGLLTLTEIAARANIQPTTINALATVTGYLSARSSGRKERPILLVTTTRAATHGRGQPRALRGRGFHKIGGHIEVHLTCAFDVSISAAVTRSIRSGGVPPADGAALRPH